MCTRTSPEQTDLAQQIVSSVTESLIATIRLLDYISVL